MMTCNGQTSLEMIRKMAEGHGKNLLLIGAFRDNEVNAVHPLMFAINRLRQAGTNLWDISLQPLQLPEIRLLISETFHCLHEAAKPLAETVFAKTGRNPFFINELLKSLYDRKLIYFDHSRGIWNWSASKIRSVDISDNIVELTAGRIQRLPEDAQEILKLGACIGNRFDLKTLTYVSGKKHDQTGAILRKAVAENLIFPVSDEYKLIGIIDKADAEYKFAHDRIQQAAYSLIPENRKESVHHRIGRLLLQNIPPEEQDERIFDIVNQFNKSVSLINTYDKRDMLAALNLSAGKKAKASAAYAPAFNYLKTGIELLREDCWENQYDTALSLHVEAAEAACLCSEFGHMEKIAASVLEKSRSLLDEVKIYNVRIMACIAQNRLLDAIKTALPILKRLGVRMPEKSNKLYILSELLRVKLCLVGKKEEYLINLPEMTDPDKLASMRLIVSISSAVYFAAPDLFPLIVFNGITLSVRHGNSIYSTIGYALILCSVAGDIDSGYRFGRLALNLMERLNAKELRARIIFIFNSFVRHWKEHLRNTLKPLIKGCQYGMETGDLEFAALCAVFYSIHSFRAGSEMNNLEREMASYSEAVTRLNQETCLYYNMNIGYLNFTGI
ncbi:MAG: hypothetical protein GY749_49910 [Desulfobacteraceae bacterium]|nr:hypothetical protein [Desulfobacteraceae bacterium]